MNPLPQQLLSARDSTTASTLTTVTPAVASPASYTRTATGRPARRIPALDFTKGALVLFMVLYHWLNYFVSPEGDYRYLRFVTTSFIFMAGFMISHVYFSKYDIVDNRLPKRLIQRGLKILGVFVFLNVIISVLFHESYNNGKVLFGDLSLRNLVAIYVTGNTVVAKNAKAAAFSILVPISYLLLLSGGFLVVCRSCRYIFHVVCTCLLLSIMALALAGLESAHLKLLTIGVIGVVSGYVSEDRIVSLVRHPYALVGAYVCYVIAITIWNVVYPLQVVGVFLSLMLIYYLGAEAGDPGRWRRHIILLGKYSLFGYIAQIAVLQSIYRSLQHVNLGVGAKGISLVGAFALTMLGVEVVDRVRAKSATVDGVYRAVFS
jgi:hypothetical protein